MKSKQAHANETKDMKEGLRTAADIRRKLKGQRHTDSTKLVSEDRGFTDDSSIRTRPYGKELLAGVTEENRHAEVDFGRPVGKEKC